MQERSGLTKILALMFSLQALWDTKVVLISSERRSQDLVFAVVVVFCILDICCCRLQPNSTFETDSCAVEASLQSSTTCHESKKGSPSVACQSLQHEASDSRSNPCSPLILNPGPRTMQRVKVI